MISERRHSPSPRQSPSPTRGILKQQSSGMTDSGQYYEAEREVPVRDTTGRAQSPAGRAKSPAGRTQSPAGRLTPGGRVSQGRGPTVSAGGRASPSKPILCIRAFTAPDNVLFFISLKNIDIFLFALWKHFLWVIRSASVFFPRYVVGTF